MTTALLADWLLPPLAPLLVVLAGLWVMKSRPRTARAMIAAGAGTLILLSVPVVGLALISALEQPYADPLQSPADAIVVLGGGTYPEAPEYGGDTVSSGSLERLRYAALLYKRSGKPILVTGGNPLGHATSEAAQMRAVLEREWNIPVTWGETTSANTSENARNSYALLDAAGIHRIYLVTHAWHMPRALRAFEQAGFTVIAAPTRYLTRRALRPADFLPDAEGLYLSARYCREILGALWYRLRSL
jgi:uncharacterized SAM-binding protein YcdF (DUF218 family)